MKHPVSFIAFYLASTWTVDRGGKKESRDISMTEDAFRSIWDGVADKPDFKAGTVKDRQRPQPAT